MEDSVFIPTQTDVSDVLKRLEEEKYKVIVEEVEKQKAKLDNKEDNVATDDLLFLLNSDSNMEPITQQNKQSTTLQKVKQLYEKYRVDESYDLDLSILELSQDYFKDLKTGFFNQYCYYGAVQSIRNYIDKGLEPPAELWMWICQARNAYLSKYQVVQHSR